MRARSPAEPLTDGVVTLRPWRLEDLDGIVAACSDPETAHWIHALPRPYSQQDARRYVAAAHDAVEAGRGVGLAVVADAQLAGSIELRIVDAANRVAEIGYWSSPEVRGRGITTRALQVLSEWAFRELDAERLQIRADVENTPSRRVAEKAGFTYEGVLRSAGYNPRLGRRIDYAVYSRLRGQA